MVYKSYLNISPSPNATLSSSDRLVYVTNPTSTSRLYQTVHCHRQTDWFMLQILPQHPTFTKRYTVIVRPTGLCYKSYLNIPPLPNGTLSSSDRLVYVTNPTSTSHLYQTVHCHRQTDWFMLQILPQHPAFTKRYTVIVRPTGLCYKSYLNIPPLPNGTLSSSDRLVYVTNPTWISHLYQTLHCHHQTDLCYKTHLNISPSPNAILSPPDRLVYVTNPASTSRLYLNPASTSRLNQTVHCHRQTDWFMLQIRPQHPTFT